MPTDRLKTLDRALDILDRFQTHEALGVAEVAQEVDLAKSTVHSYLATLTERGYLRQNEAGKYELTLKFLGLGGLARQRLPIERPIRTLLMELAETTGQSAAFATEVDGEFTFVDLVRGENSVQTEVHVGWSAPIQTLPEGKLILAHLPERRQEVILDRIGASEPLVRELEQLRARDEFLTSDGSVVEGVTTISGPVFTDSDTFHGIVILATPTRGIATEGIDTYASILREKLARFEVNVSARSS